MIRRRNGGKLIRGHEPEEDVNPMAVTGNIVDAMLVLAVGMMLALVTHHGVDLAQGRSSMQELENAESIPEEQVKEVETNEGLEKKGVAYQDPETGKFYIRQEE